MAFKRLVTGVVLGLAMVPAQAALNVFACEPEWADLVLALVPDADVHTATSAGQDPHYIEARPSLISAMRRADLAVCTGASLEAGWLPALISRASNSVIRPGKPGLFFAAEQVTLHQPQDHVDRSMGDVHPEGDPHIHLDPDRVPVIVDALADRIIELAPDQENAVRLRQRQWQVRWNLEKAQWRDAAEKLEGTQVAVQHATFGYLLRWLGVETAIDLEPKPGLPPSASHLSKVLSDPALERAELVLIASYQDRRPAQWLSKKTGLPVEVVPGTVTGEAGSDSLSALVSQLIDRLLQYREEHAPETAHHD
ncbi:zinc ABC transporter substrate-binding protein [Marinobacter sp. HL-58]|uniref:metal ABC transporter solute-binding protein, Zn/Mn family n=1 Tax=Marinobacter sp. HL-58 TaxID=1479237 RepID=UPI0004887A67|nr:zinc ABC transporter substrate-binding protein [Marinobacter sp. HL-58]KPQ00214.1 MAG: ABC-type transport system substrate-binding component [Marinobacter sp. HL-58]